MNNFSSINYEVMTNTVHQYQSNPVLKEAVRSSIERQYMVAEDDSIDLPKAEASTTHYIVSGKRSFEAAKCYPSKKVAVLNFANNHSIGGSPFYAGAQEESLCRCSTLFPCLQAMDYKYYRRHKKQFEHGEINYLGNDDLIYTPDVVVFKTDERTIPIRPVMMQSEEWYKVDVITCAAPELWRGNAIPPNYEALITRRIKRILDVAAKEKVEVLILGAWGCGAFKNPSEVVARVFFSLLRNYNFETVEFALSSRDDVSHSVFAQCCENMKQ